MALVRCQLLVTAVALGLAATAVPTSTAQSDPVGPTLRNLNDILLCYMLGLDEMLQDAWGDDTGNWPGRPLLHNTIIPLVNQATKPLEDLAGPLSQTYRSVYDTLLTTLRTVEDAISKIPGAAHDVKCFITALMNALWDATGGRFLYCWDTAGAGGPNFQWLYNALESLLHVPPRLPSPLLPPCL